MVVTRGAQKALIFTVAACIGVIYMFAWLAPAIGLYHDDGVYLVTARSILDGHGYSIESLPYHVSQTKYPPVFPLLLALFSAVSGNAQWLKLVPLACTAGWLALTWKLLRKMGATSNSAFFLIAVTAASPTVIFLGTNLLSEPLFALLVTAALLTLIDGERPLLAGVLAGLATVTRVAGVPLIAAGIFTYLLRRRSAGAVRFAAGAVIFAAPWFGWAAAHSQSLEPYYGLGNYSGLSILGPGLAAGDKFRVLAFNVLFLLAAPYSLITGLTNMLASIATGILLFWAVLKRRQLVPDLFVLFYCLLLLTWAGPPQRFIAPVLPLALWLILRCMQSYWPSELVAAIMVVILAIQLFVDFQRLPETRRSGVFTASGQAIDDWPQVQRLCGFLQTQTPPDSIVLANLDPVIYLQSGRHAVRGFNPNGFDLFYAPTRRPVGAFQLLRSIRASQVNYVAVMPDRDFVEAPGFRNAVLALERDGVVEPVAVEGLASGYRIWKVIRP